MLCSVTMFWTRSVYLRKNYCLLSLGKNVCLIRNELFMFFEVKVKGTYVKIFLIVLESGVRNHYNTHAS